MGYFEGDGGAKKRALPKFFFRIFRFLINRWGGRFAKAIDRVDV